MFRHCAWESASPEVGDGVGPEAGDGAEPEAGDGIGPEAGDGVGDGAVAVVDVLTPHADSSRQNLPELLPALQQQYLPW